MNTKKNPATSRPDVCAPGRKPDETWRVFIAIELPRELRARVAERVAILRAKMPDVAASWAREENLHLTLKFLGEIPVARVERLSGATRVAAQTVRQFELEAGGCGAFPPHGQPRVLWIGIDDSSGKLTQLHEALENDCEQAGFAREARRLHPHLTIARVRRPHGSKQLAELHSQQGFASETFSVSELLVIRSELSSQGSRYTTVARHLLG